MNVNIIKSINLEDNVDFNVDLEELEEMLKRFEIINNQKAYLIMNNATADIIITNAADQVYTQGKINNTPDGNDQNQLKEYLGRKVFIDNDLNLGDIEIR